ncbi:hypothetical protein BDW72DRAFT_198656 [Aspergillus terricola var. indicus]
MAKYSLNAHMDATNHSVAPRTSPTTSGKVARYLQTIGTSSMLMVLLNQGASLAENICERYDAPDCARYIKYLYRLVNLVVLLFVTTRWIWRRFRSGGTRIIDRVNRPVILPAQEHTRSNKETLLFSNTHGMDDCADICLN